MGQACASAATRQKSDFLTCASDPCREKPQTAEICSKACLRGSVWGTLAPPWGIGELYGIGNSVWFYRRFASFCVCLEHTRGRVFSSLNPMRFGEHKRRSVPRGLRTFSLRSAALGCLMVHAKGTSQKHGFVSFPQNHKGSTRNAKVEA